MTKRFVTASAALALALGLSLGGTMALPATASARILEVIRSLSSKSMPLRTATSVVSPLVDLKAGERSTCLA